MKGGTRDPAEEVGCTCALGAMSVPALSCSLLLSVPYSTRSRIEPLPHAFVFVPVARTFCQMPEARDHGTECPETMTPKQIISHSDCLCWAFHHHKAKVAAGHTRLTNSARNTTTIGRNKKLLQQYNC